MCVLPLLGVGVEVHAPEEERISTHIMGDWGTTRAVGAGQPRTKSFHVRRCRIVQDQGQWKHSEELTGPQWRPRGIPWVPRMFLN